MKKDFCIPQYIQKSALDVISAYPFVFLKLIKKAEERSGKETNDGDTGICRQDQE